MSARARWRPFVRTSKGTFTVDLGRQERQVLRALPEQLRQALAEGADGQAFRRLFPPAYEHDEEGQKDYLEFARPELDENRAAALSTLSQTAEAEELSEAELDAWLRALNDLRLWLGTLLDVGEDSGPGDLEDPYYLLYQVLTELQGWAIEAITGED